LAELFVGLLALIGIAVVIFVALYRWFIEERW
jgi:hypothetical protein